MSSGGLLVKVSALNGRIENRYNVQLDIAVSQGAALSPDAKELAYVHTRPPTGAPDCGDAKSPCPAYALYLAPIKTGHRRKVGDDTGAASWSADGKEIAYVATGKLTIDVVETGKKTKLSAGTHVPQADPPPGSRERSADGEDALHAGLRPVCRQRTVVGHLAAVVEEEQEDLLLRSA